MRVLLVFALGLASLSLLTMRAMAPFPASEPATTAASTTFAEGFAERLATVQLAADALVDLGARRERNLLVVSQRQLAMNAALDSTDAWLARQTAPSEGAAVAAYRAGAADIRRAMTDAQSAFFRLDWDGVAAANETLRQGAAEITSAREVLRIPGER